jgi:hypothetical protein
MKSMADKIFRILTHENRSVDRPDSSLCKSGHWLRFPGLETHRTAQLIPRWQIGSALSMGDCQLIIQKA